MKILVSACLLGIPCRYDGKSRPSEAVLMLSQKHQLVPFCPEIYGGLPTPRPPAEIRGGRVVNCAGTDVTEQYERGAREALHVCRITGCEAAVLKSNSPSCGVNGVYDGTFTRTLIPGDGVMARLLKETGIPVMTENQIEKL